MSARMNRQETINLLQDCENARANAVTGGASNLEAHEMAQRVWNDWAATMLNRRKQLENLGLWLAQSENVDSLFTKKRGLNAETIQWISDARASFNDLHFFSENFPAEPSSTTRKSAKTFGADALNLSGFT